jgi:FkbM family methyltransferase
MKIETRYGRLSIFDEAEELISKSLRLYGEWAQNEIDILGEFVSSGDIVIDAGAFIGTHTRAFSAMVGNFGFVHAFEPNVTALPILKENISGLRCNNVAIHSIALGEVESLGYMINAESVNLGSTKVLMDLSHPEKSVLIKPLDALGLENVAFIKADIEGMELSLLQGALVTITKFRPVIFLEVLSVDSSVGLLAWACKNNYFSFGVITPAFNIANFNGEKDDIYNEAKECGFLLIPEEKFRNHAETLYRLQLPKISSVDEAALLLLHKPQYAYEVLERTAAGAALGICYHTPLLNQTVRTYDIKIQELVGDNRSNQIKILSLDKLLKAAEKEKFELSLASAERERQVHQSHVERVIELHDRLMESKQELLSVQSQISSLHVALLATQREILDQSLAAESRERQWMEKYRVQRDQCRIFQNNTENVYNRLQAQFQTAEQQWREVCSVSQGDMTIRKDTQVPKSVTDLLNLYDEQFVHAAYRSILGRRPDPEGFQYYSNRVRQGVSKLDIIRQLCSSNEAKSKSVPLIQVDEVLIPKWRQIFINIAKTFGWVDTQHERKTRALENQLFILSNLRKRHFDELGVTIRQFQGDVSRLIALLNDHAFTPKLETTERMVAIVLPVYRDVNMTRSCIAAAIPSIASTPRARLVLVNDASPDVGMSQMLEAQVRRWPDVVMLINNESNLGFVCSVNKGMKVFPEHDIVLLNSDVIVPKDWLKRLKRDAYSRPRVGTVTPLSNNTTISTFPEFMQDNPMPFDMDVDAVDDYFRSKKLDCIEAPTGIGFCMYIRRECLMEVGYFDEEKFGRGYGEENDFCQRSLKHGWLNLISPNMYVYHKGGVSFGDEKHAQIENAMRVMDRLHPAYHIDVQEFIKKDPLREARIERYSALLKGLPIPKILHISHGIGGGVGQHIEELAAFLHPRAASLVLIPHADRSKVTLRFGYRSSADEVVISINEQYDRLISIFREIGVTGIHYHHVLNLNSALLNLPDELQIPYYFTAHDFYLLNGNPTLTGEDGVYRGNIGEAVLNPLYPLPLEHTVSSWRSYWAPFVMGANHFIFPSFSTAELFSDIYQYTNTVVAHHPEQVRDIRVEPVPYKKKQRYIVGILGAIGIEKGSNYLEAVAHASAIGKKNIDYVLIGYANRPLKGVKECGAYLANDLNGLITAHACDIIFFAARWPETYSYTLSYALASGLPIAAPNIGVFPERLAGRKNVLIYNYLDSPDSCAEQLGHFIKSLGEDRNLVYNDGHHRLPDAQFYETTYLECSTALRAEKRASRA